ncbi:MAG: hypothetical protein KGJ60_13855 [Verrucomicrobiota bacterium]|nr:hypothetical protein [Verrucomicrobiota bacterium]
MNPAQIKNIVSTILQSGLGILVGRGLITGNESNSIGGAIAALFVFFITHHWHSISSPPSPTSGGKAGGILQVLLAAFAAGFLSAGCASTPQQTIYRAAGSSVVSVDAAMKLWDAYVAANHPGTNAEKRVKSDFERYQSAMSVALDAGAAYAATSGTNSTALAGFQNAVSHSSQDLIDLESLIASFGVKLNTNAP